jgi:hypothetical protein
LIVEAILIKNKRQTPASNVAGRVYETTFRKLAQRVLSSEKTREKSLIGSLEEDKGSGYYMSHLIEKQKVLVISQCPIDHATVPPHRDSQN